jgi:hypothetical protein
LQGRNKTRGKFVRIQGIGRIHIHISTTGRFTLQMDTR